MKLGGNKTTLIYCRSFFSRRDEDRTILLELKTRGASRETFAALSDKLNKPSSQVTTHVCLSYTLLQKKKKKIDFGFQINGVLNVLSSQVAHRFYQLMKIFRKQEKKDV